MSKANIFSRMNRRDFLKAGLGVMAATAGAGLLPKALLTPHTVVDAAAAPFVDLPYNKSLVGTDGWIYLPPNLALAPYHPDDMAPVDLNTYMFGFRDVTGLTPGQTIAQKMKCQASAPLLDINEGDTYVIQLGNLGLQMRPDLTDSHTLHYHGFRNAIPMFDGEPASTVAVPIGRTLKYVYKPHDAGTYMWHCHFEDTEHVQMGMVGPAIIRPLQNTTTEKFAYNDGDGSTQYDREFVMFLSEIWAFAHWCDSHIQLPDWSDYRPEFFLMNGRSYPDTLAPQGGGPDLGGTGDLIAPLGRPELQYQPVSSLIQANEGERVLLRFVNLGFQVQSMTLPGIKMKVVAKDATLLRNGSTNLYFETNTISVGPGESVDAIFTAPSGADNPATYMLYDRNLGRMSNGGLPGMGGMATEVRVFPAGTLPAQTEPNT